MSVEVVSSEYQKFEELNFDVVTQSQILRDKKERIDTFYHGGELQAVWMMDSWSAAESLHHREKELQIDKKRLYSIDMEILSLYLKVLSFQSSKIQFIMKKLESLCKKNANESCPADYSEQSYQEWSRTSPKIHALQSQILDLLSQKIKLNYSFLDGDKFFESPRNREDRNNISIEKLRSQTYFFIERDPLVDTEFSLHVSNVVNVEANTFESERLRSFIHQCRNMNDTQNICEYYQEFIGALTEHILTKFGHMRRSGFSTIDITRDQIFAIIEGHLIPHLYDCITEDDDGDEIICKQYKRLSGFNQSVIGIKDEYIDPSVWPYNEAILKLKALPIVILPTQKLRAVILASQAAMKRMVDVCAKKNVVAGADEFIDVWVYIVLQAGIQNLCSNLKYLRNFCNPNYMLSETGYYLSSLELAAEFIKGIQNDDDMVDGTSSQKLSNDFFLSMSSNNLKRLCKLGKIEIIDENYQLEGYNLLASMDCLRNPCRLAWAIFHEALHSKPTTVSLCRVTKNYSMSKLKVLLFGEKLHVQFRSLKTDPTILLPVFDSSKASVAELDLSQCNTFELPKFVAVDDGSDATRNMLLLFSNLSFVGMESNIKDYITDFFRVKSEVELNMGRQFSDTFVHILKEPSVTDIIQSMQMLLKKLGKYSQRLRCDDNSSFMLMKAIQNFQHEYNTNLKRAMDALRTDGIADVKTVMALRNALCSAEH